MGRKEFLLWFPNIDSVLIGAKVVAYDRVWGEWLVIEKDGKKYRITAESLEGAYLAIEEVVE